MFPQPVLAAWLSYIFFYKMSLLLLLQNVTRKPWPQILATLLNTNLFLYLVVVIALAHAREASSPLLTFLCLTKLPRLALN